MLDAEAARFLLGLIWQQFWIGAALVLLVAICLRTSRQLNAATRHWIWAFTLITVALLPLPAFFPDARVPAVAAAGAEKEFARAGLRAAGEPPAFVFSDDTQAKRKSIVSGIDEAIRRPALIRGLATTLALLWSIGSLWMLFGLLRSARMAARLQRESRPAPLSPRPADIPADIRLSSLARSPMVVGLRRPSVLIPESVFARVSREELQRILDHELAHLRRRDHWLMLLQKLIEAAYFFQPAVRFAARHLDEEREISCDDRAALDQRNHYADSLIRICKAIVGKPSPAPLAVGAVRSPSQLTHRIACLLDGTRNHSPDVSRASLALSALVLMAAMACATEFMPHIARADELPAQRADFNDDAPAYGTPLIAAAAAGDLASMRSLIEAGADVNEAFAANEPRSPLNAAARGGHLDAVNFLLSRGAEVDRVVPGDATALIDAARSGHVEIVALLLESGADSNRVVPGDGTALTAAARSGSKKAVQLLLEYDADPDIVAPGDGSALAAASGRGNEEIVAILLAGGADPDVFTEGDPGAMMEAAALGEVATLERLAAAGGDVNSVSPGDGTPLIAAARRGSLPAARWLLDHGASVDLPAQGDGNPLIMAAAHGHTDVVRLLLDRGAEIDAVVPGDETALIASAGRGALDSVRLLLERGADVNLKVPAEAGPFGETQIRTALSQAEAGGHEDVVQLLIAHGANR